MLSSAIPSSDIDRSIRIKLDTKPMRLFLIIIQYQNSINITCKLLHKHSVLRNIRRIPHQNPSLHTHLRVQGQNHSNIYDLNIHVPTATPYGAARTLH